MPRKLLRRLLAWPAPFLRPPLATIWYVVAQDEYELAECSVLTHLEHDWVGHIVLLYTGSRKPPRFGALSRVSSKVREIWRDFGSGLDVPLDRGGFDQIAARNHAVAIAEACDDTWLIQCDADEVYLEGLGTALAEVTADIVAVTRRPG